MKRKIQYLTIEEILLIHFVVMEGFFIDYEPDIQEEQAGVKSPSGLLSAIGEPRQTFNKQELYSNILEKAATLIRSMIQNHPFHNGNKRTAVLSTIVFLEVNGYRVEANDNKLLGLAMTIARSKPSIKRIVRSLKKFTKDSYVSVVRTGKMEKLIDGIRKIIIDDSKLEKMNNELKSFKK